VRLLRDNETQTIGATKQPESRAKHENKNPTGAVLEHYQDYQNRKDRMKPKYLSNVTTSTMSLARRFRVTLLGLELILVIWAIINPFIALQPIVILTSVTLISLITLLSIIYSSVRQAGEAAKREYEWTIGQLEKANEDNLSLQTAEKNIIRQGMEYITQRPIGPERQLELLHESSWWSARISILSAIVTAVFSIISLSLFATTLSVLLENGNQQITKSVSHGLILNTFVLFAGGKLVIATLGFLRFGSASSQIERDVLRISINGDQRGTAAINILLANYQAERATSPLLLQPVWRLARARMNHQYIELRKNLEQQLPPIETVHGDL
jgi:hypothetical protein